PMPTTDRDRTVSRRSEPSSRTALMGEQPNPWDRLQPQDAMSRHRGTKPPRRCELLGEISLLSPAWLLSVERCPLHAEPPDHEARLASLVYLYVSELRSLLSVHSSYDFQPFSGNLWAPPLLFERRPPQSDCLPETVSGPDHGPGLEGSCSKGGIPRVPPRKLALTFQRLPPILYKLHKHSISGYSKAPRGLSVLSRVMRIFTHSIISPGLSLRQRSEEHTSES